jgi:hypothetical protein
METISSKNMLKSVMNGLNTQSTATVGQKIMIFADDGTPIGKMQAPTEQQGAPLVFEENAQATASTQPSDTASDETMGKLYLVGPSSGTKFQWITIENDSVTPATYSWLPIGTTDVDLSQYAKDVVATDEEVRAIVDDYVLE